MRRTEILATALGVVLLAAPAFAACDHDRSAALGRNIVLAQAGGGGGGSSASSQQGGSLNSATPGSPGSGILGSTPQEMQGRSQQPAQGAAVPLAPGSSSGRGASDPSTNSGRMQTAPGGTGVMPGDTTTGTTRR